jgi:hypothetical protein
VFGPKLKVHVELGDGLSKGLRVPDHLADRCLIVGVQHASEGGANDGHGVQGEIVLVDPLQIGPHPATILRRTGTFPARTERVAMSWVHRQHRFEPEVTDPVIDEVVDVAETLPPMEAQRCQRDVARIDIEAGTAQTSAPVSLAMDMKIMQALVAPGEDDLERRMERSQRHVAANEEPAPDQGTDPLQNHAELIDMRWDE